MITAKTLLVAGLIGFGGASVTTLSVQRLAAPAAESPKVVVLREVVVTARAEPAGNVITLPSVQIVGDSVAGANPSRGGIPGS